MLHYIFFHDKIILRDITRYVSLKFTIFKIVLIGVMNRFNQLKFLGGLKESSIFLLDSFSLHTIFCIDNIPQ